MEVTEEQIRRWVRDEEEKIQLEKQAACSHARSGTLYEGSIACDQCGKVITEDDMDGTLSGNEERYRR